LQSINLTRITTRANPAKGEDPLQGPKTEYSSKEISPSALLSKQLERAYRIFLLHNGRSLSDLYVRLSRDGFCKLLSRFWDSFTGEWDVLLHGNPAVDYFSGIKLSAGGELGMGVGEEEWGSGERDVLEGLINDTDGCVDVVVARYGEAPIIPAKGQHPNLFNTGQPSQHASAWLGVAGTSQSSDGIIFTGSSNVSRKSLKEVSDWMNLIHIYGEAAYGVRDNPRSVRRRSRPRPLRASKTPTSIASQRPKNKSREPSERAESHHSSPHPGIPPPIVSAAEQSLESATKGADKKVAKDATQLAKTKPEEKTSDTWMKILTFGLAGSTTSEQKNPQTGISEEVSHPPRQRQESKESTEITADIREVDPVPDIDAREEKIQEQIRLENEGYFLIGLKGELDEQFADAEGNDNRILLRTMYIETIASQASFDDETPTVYSARSPSLSDGQAARTRRLRVLVYVQRPFIYTFLFQLGTDALQLSSFYRTLHLSLSSMHRGLNLSTSPDRVAQRLRTAGGSYSTSAASLSSRGINDPKTALSDDQPIFDLIYDPQTLNIHANVPSIPYPGTLAAEALSGAASKVGWTRADALNVHSAIIEGLQFAGRNGTSESSLKTNRGWWIVYLKIEIHDSSDLMTPRAEMEQSDRPSHMSSAQGKAEELRRAISAPHTPTEPGTSQPSRHAASTTSIKSPSASASLDINKQAATPPSSAEFPTPTSTSQDSNPYFPSMAPSSTATPRQPAYKEAVLVRRARDSSSLSSLSAGAGKGRVDPGGGGGLWSFGSSMLGRDAGSGWGPARLAEGVGVDAKKYVEGLIGLGR